MKKKWVKYLLLFWVGMGIYNYLFHLNIPPGKEPAFILYFCIDQLLYLPYFYFNYKIITPIGIRKMAWLIPLHLFVAVGACFILSVIPYLHYYLQGLNPFFSVVYFYKLFGVFLWTHISIAIGFLTYWQESEKQRRDLINANHKAELSFLRSQINPHFLLNTLNGIYSLSLKSSEKTYSMISDLHQLMSYITNDTESTTLDREINYLKSYIQIQQNRMGNHLTITTSFNYDKDYTTEPFLLITFAENAFKHGVSMKDSSFISFKLTCYNSILEYEVENSYHKNLHKDKTSGIGLSNLQRRLDLSFPDNHELLYYEKENTFTSLLKVTLR